MNRAKLLLSATLLGGFLTVTACSHIFSPETSIPASHPESLAEGRVDCSECHEDNIKGVLKPYATFVHTPAFLKNHRYFSARDGLCIHCHAGSFCNDCHAAKLEIKIPVRYGYRPDRELVHRGDFMTRHKIEGKLDPSSCYRCHGRTNNEQCFACHKN